MTSLRQHRQEKIEEISECVSTLFDSFGDDEKKQFAIMLARALAGSISTKEREYWLEGLRKLVVEDGR